MLSPTLPLHVTIQCRTTDAAKAVLRIVTWLAWLFGCCNCVYTLLWR